MGTRFVAIGGGTGSGKSTLAEALSDRLGAPILRIDDYYRDQSGVPFDDRLAVNYDAPESVEHDLLLGHLIQLAQGERIEKPIYDFTHHTRSALTERVDPAPVVLIEGIFALCWDALAARCDARLFVETPAEVRFRRRLRRDVEERGRDAHEVTERFWRHVAPMHDLWVAPSKARATRVVGGEEPIERLVGIALDEISLGGSSRPAPRRAPGLSAVLFAGLR